VHVLLGALLKLARGPLLQQIIGCMPPIHAAEVLPQDSCALHSTVTDTGCAAEPGCKGQRRRPGRLTLDSASLLWTGPT